MALQDGISQRDESEIEAQMKPGYSYYLCLTRKVYGDPEQAATLFAAYMRAHDVSLTPGRFDGASLIDGKIVVIHQNTRLP
jgi:hypothetical protein